MKFKVRLIVYVEINKREKPLGSGKEVIPFHLRFIEYQKSINLLLPKHSQVFENIWIVV